MNLYHDTFLKSEPMQSMKQAGKTSVAPHLRPLRRVPSRADCQPLKRPQGQPSSSCPSFLSWLPPFRARGNEISTRAPERKFDLTAPRPSHITSRVGLEGFGATWITSIWNPSRCVDLEARLGTGGRERRDRKQGRTAEANSTT